MRGHGRRGVIARVAAVLALTSLVGCSATRLSDVWKDPGYDAAPLRNVAVFVLGSDPGLQRLAEDEFVRRLPMNTRGMGGYGLVPTAEQGDLEKVRARLRAGGFDGAIVARVTGVDGASPGASGGVERIPVSYRTLADYYASTSPPPGPADAPAPTSLRVQTNVYTVASESLIWSGSSRTFRPDVAREAAGDVAKAVVEHLQQAGILSVD
jgi:hypothetical protein